MRREAVINKITEEVKRLNDLEIRKLIHAGKIEKLKQIKKSFESLDEDDMPDRGLLLKIDEIPKGYCLGIVFYLIGTEIDDNYFFYDWNEFAIRIANEEGDIGKSIAVKMTYLNLASFSIEDLVDKSEAVRYTENEFKIAKCKN